MNIYIYIYVCVFIQDYVTTDSGAATQLSSLAMNWQQNQAEGEPHLSSPNLHEWRLLFNTVSYLKQIPLHTHTHIYINIQITGIHNADAQSSLIC